MTVHQDKESETQKTCSTRRGRHAPRVLFIAPVPPPVHGVTICMANLMAMRDSLPFDLVHLDSRFTDNPLELGKFSFRKFCLLFTYLARLLKLLLFGSINCVVIPPTFYFHPFVKDAVFIWFARLLGKPVIGWIHNDFRLIKSEMPGWKQRFASLTLNRLEMLVLVGESLRQQNPEWLDSRRITTIPNGVADPPIHRPSNRTPRQQPRLIYISQMNQAKGSQDLLDAAALLAAEGLHPEIHCYGRPAFETTQEMIEVAFNEARAKGVNAQWLGPIYDDAKWAALADADIFVFPSWHEAMPLAVLEAMAVGLPIVATNVGAVADALDGIQGGRLVEPKQPAALAGALKEMMSKPAELDAMGHFNRQRYLREFTREAYANRWSAFFRERFAAA